MCPLTWSLHHIIRPPGQTLGRGYLQTSTQHTFLRSHQPPALPTCLSPSPPSVPQIYGYHSSWAGTAPCTCFTSSVHVHTSTVPDATTNTLGTVSVPSCLTRQLTPFRASADSTPHSQGPGVGTHPSHQTAAGPPGLQAIRRTPSLHPQVPWACISHSSS